MLKILLSNVISTVCRFLTFAIVADALLSWVPQYNETIYRIRNVLQKLTSPVMSPVRKLLQPLTGRMMIDFSPIVAILLIEFVQGLIIRLIWAF